MQPVHDRLADLENRKGGETVADQRAKDAPALQLGEQRQRHPHPPRADRTPYHASTNRQTMRAVSYSWPLRSILVCRDGIAVPTSSSPLVLNDTMTSSIRVLAVAFVAVVSAYFGAVLLVQRSVRVIDTDAARISRDAAPDIRVVSDLARSFARCTRASSRPSRVTMKP